jgi:hypothetical protein
MKFSNLTYFTFALTLLLAGCGRAPVSEQQPVSNPSTQTTGGGAAETCPLYFPSEDLCAQLSWVKGPSADVESTFDVSFWKKTGGSSTGPFTEPTSQVGSYIRMTCCGSVFASTVSKKDEGQYSVTKVGFFPGSWEVYVQLKKGESVEKQFVPVKLDD